MADRGDAREPLQIGETVSVNDLIWERIESLAQDARREEEMQSKFTRLHISDATKCERYELKIDYVVMDQVCTWSHYQVDILLYD